MNNPLTHLKATTIISSTVVSSKAIAPTISSGFSQLDECLPNGGWPLGVLIELLIDQVGVGELSLLLPALRASAQSTGWIHWINPPYTPYAPALAAAQVPLERLLEIRVPEIKNQLWAIEQSLQSSVCRSVMSWLGYVDERWLRRLQIQAHQHQTLCVLWRALKFQSQRSPAALRISLTPTTQGLTLELIKSRNFLRPWQRLLPWEQLWAPTVGIEGQ